MSSDLSVRCLSFYWVNEWKSFSHVWLFVSPWIVAHQALLCPWNSPGKNIGVGCHSLLQGIFPNQGSNPALLFYLLLVLLPFGLYPTGFFGNCAYICVTAFSIPLHFSLGWIWRAKTGKHLRPDTLTEKQIRAAVSFSFPFLFFIIFLNVIYPFINLYHFIL